jgi:hypothetical protein
MNHLDLLPDNWAAASDFRSNKYRTQSLKELRSKKDSFEFCNGCDAFRIRLIDVYGYEFVMTSCVFINKCIKQYPHRVDNEEFK